MIKHRCSVRITYVLGTDRPPQSHSCEADQFREGRALQGHFSPALYLVDGDRIVVAARLAPCPHEARIGRIKDNDAAGLPRESHQFLQLLSGRAGTGRVVGAGIFRVIGNGVCVRGGTLLTSAGFVCAVFVLSESVETM